MTLNELIAKREAKKLEFLTKKYGHFTKEEALQLAIEAEQYCRDCGPFDQAYSYFKQEQLALEDYALLLEHLEGR